MPKKGGLYYDIYKSPLSADDPENLDGQVEDYAWPDSCAPWRFHGMREQALQYRQAQKFVVANSLTPGTVTLYSWLRGFEGFFMDFALIPHTVECFLDKITDLSIAYWDKLLSEVGPYVDMINEADDIAGQNGLMISADTYRQIVKPRHKRIITFIKKKCPHIKIFMHSCGAVRELIPDFIEMGANASKLRRT